MENGVELYLDDVTVWKVHVYLLALRELMGVPTENSEVKVSENWRRSSSVLVISVFPKKY